MATTNETTHGNNAMVPMPQYQCHKKVWALKIKEIREIGNGTTDKYGAYILPEEPHFGPIEVSQDFVDKHNPQVGGYLVQYEDGYKSFSPGRAFDDGYTLIKGIDPLFQFHKLNQEGIDKAKLIAEHFTILLNNLRKLCPEGTREFSIVKTKLEEASFFAKKAMAVSESNQD